MGAAEPARRRFVTRAEVNDAAAAGHGIRLGPRDVLTDEAATRARDLGVTLERLAAVPAPAAGASGTADEAALRRALRDAVAAELGADTPGLDAAIDTVLARHRNRS